jgi:hypothetical protein
LAKPKLPTDCQVEKAKKELLPLHSPTRHKRSWSKRILHPETRAQVKPDNQNQRAFTRIPLPSPTAGKATPRQGQKHEYHTKPASKRCTSRSLRLTETLPPCTPRKQIRSRDQRPSANPHTQESQTQTKDTAKITVSHVANSALPQHGKTAFYVSAQKQRHSVKQSKPAHQRARQAHRFQCSPRHFRPKHPDATI